MEVIQIIDATTKCLNFTFDVRIFFATVFLLVLGICLALLSDNFGGIATGVTAIALGTAIFFAGQCEMVEEPQTNYLIVCDDEVTVKEVMKEYRIIEQVGLGLVVTKKGE